MSARIHGWFDNFGDFLNPFNDGPVGSWKGTFKKQFDIVIAGTTAKSQQRLNALTRYQNDLLTAAKASGMGLRDFDKLEEWSYRLLLKAHDPQKFKNFLKWVFFPIGIISGSKRNNLLKLLDDAAEFFVYLYLPDALLNDPQAQHIRNKVVFQAQIADEVVKGLNISQATFDTIINSSIERRHGKNVRAFILDALKTDLQFNPQIGAVPIPLIINLSVKTLKVILGIIAESKAKKAAKEAQIKANTISLGDFGSWVCPYIAQMGGQLGLSNHCVQVAEEEAAAASAAQKTSLFGSPLVLGFGGLLILGFALMGDEDKDEDEE